MSSCVSYRSSVYGIIFWNGSGVYLVKKFFFNSGWGRGGGPLCRCLNSECLTSLLAPLYLKGDMWETEAPTFTGFFTKERSGFLRKYWPGSMNSSPTAFDFTYFSNKSLVPFAGLFNTLFTRPTSDLSRPKFYFISFSYEAWYSMCLNLLKLEAEVDRKDHIVAYLIISKKYHSLRSSGVLFTSEFVTILSETH